MLTTNLAVFCDKNKEYKAKLKGFLNAESLEKHKYERILEILCEFLMNPKYTKDVVDCFPHLLLTLVSMAIPIEQMKMSPSINKDIIHKLNCVILGKVIHISHNLLTYVLNYFELNLAPFESMDLHSVTPMKRQNVNKVPLNVLDVSDYDIVTACYNILQCASSHFKHKWKWSKFYKYLLNEDDRVKWVALKCISIILELSEASWLTCAQLFIKDIQGFLINYEERYRNIPSTTLKDVQLLHDIIKDIPSLMTIGGILLPVFKKVNNAEDYKLVSVSSMEKNFQSLAIAVASRKCICLQGPVGCGKTALVEYLAAKTGHDSSNFIKVQLGDQTDSKMLLGMYKCTDIPGEFVWQPGVLTEAVTAGKWLLLEDIDSATLDVASVLSNLIETETLSVPGYRDTIHVNTGFQLFVTQRLILSATGLQRQISAASNLLQKHWFCINIEPLSKNELVTVIQTLFPPLHTVATKMVDVFLLFSMGDHDDEDNSNQNLISKNGRQISTRDLIKWCSRAVVDFDVSSLDSALKIFQDAVDVFGCSEPDQGQRLQLATAVAHKLGIVKTKAEYFCNIYKPSVNLSPELFIAGRAKLKRKRSQYVTMDHKKVYFSFTRPSSCLLERIATCVMQKEPVLLVGETGTGKTSSIQYLARCTEHKLIVINMNQQSESVDLLGGYKPVDIQFLISPIREEFEILFRSYFAIEPNKKFLDHIGFCYKQNKWKTLFNLMNHSTNAAIKRLQDMMQGQTEGKSCINVKANDTKTVMKRESACCNKDVNCQNNLELLRRWETIANKLKKLELQIKFQYNLAFSFIEGSVVKALREGHWILLDEINLANAETLECLSGLLEGTSGSLCLLERGDKESVKRHPDFTIFACMNPATDIGKKDLPVGLRNRFTEFYVDELTEKSDLLLLVDSYLKELNLPTKKYEAIVKFYLNVRREATTTLLDGTGHKPHYSLRTLCRALSISALNPCKHVLRSLYEAVSLSFLTQLDYNSYSIVQTMISKAILDNRNTKEILESPIPMPNRNLNEKYTCFEGYWILQGSLSPQIQENYILTKSVKRNLKDLVRIVSIGKIPVLLQGDTSVGKTSLITYLAKASGHVCVRINNHEHTDLQEYIGSYVADKSGKLVFKEGVLVDAMRKGHWIILDELNLAPSDVLEALNRVLDDNRELFIPEIQQTVKAHNNFMLFATQNPSGLYGGRKVLSRAFRNRFVELHFDEIPANELQTILHKRCRMPESYCKQIINVMTDLQIRRKSTAAFAGKKGFITLRDLFRWGERYRLAPDVNEKFYDWSKHLADEGYLVLAAKVRKLEEADEIRQVIKKHLNRDVDPNTLFTLNEKTSPVSRHILEQILSNDIPEFKHVVWTYHMRKMAVLVKKSCQFKEPVLLVGETGSGKTTICQLIAAMDKQIMYNINCHMHSESSDFLGNLRPVREHSTEDSQKLFEWVDGPLINAMRDGGLFLADEISLADDSVLERLNSLLEPERSLLLAERGVELSNSNENDNIIVADERFIFIGTMNPGGDYGKKELSPALRNRFTEIWCEGCTLKDDLGDIIEHNLQVNLEESKKQIAIAILNFVEWLSATEVGKKLVVTIRDILTWVKFINTCKSNEGFSKLSIGEAYYHGACLTYIDSLGSGLTSSDSLKNLSNFRSAAITYIKSEITNTLCSDTPCEELVTSARILSKSNTEFGITPFYIAKGSCNVDENEKFSFLTPTTKSNTLKLLRALQLRKPILLEGSPGVGKTSLVSALAKASEHAVLRINLSDQTDISDLFGADLPVEGGKGCEFAWRDGPFLQALRAGHWILLDELNLASQSVLEGLNACFDHRGEIYIPELGKTFVVKYETRIFACQNPLKQGGARRGLPKSFLNRFTQVFIDALDEDDLKFILTVQFPELSQGLISDMVKFNNKLASEIGVSWGFIGSPWEMNLRDLTRWCEATVTGKFDEIDNEINYNPGDAMELVYISRMRTQQDRQTVRNIYQEIFSPNKYSLTSTQLPMYITTEKFYIGDTSLRRTNSRIYADHNLLLLRRQKTMLRHLMQCVNMNWMSILIGGSGCGKSNLVRLLAGLVGQKLRCISVNSAMDTTEMLGGFEQADYNHHFELLFERVEALLIDSFKKKLDKDNLKRIAELHGMLEKIVHLSDDNADSLRSMSAEVKFFLFKIDMLSELILSAMSFEPSCQAELQYVGRKLENLKALVEQDKCLNAGGKFEWVDSMLVKCLQDGSWLLIDQVNLCSPAVLDRLNGLLEPNGVLSIGERGVDSQGNVITIKPHKNFRLFLTMDPRYGEISRAMRNRGVEIYILGPKENVDYDIIDLKSLLHNSGVTDHCHQNILLEIHQRLSKEIFIINELSNIELLHTAFLVIEQLVRGFPVKESIKNACIDVYIKAKFIRDSQVKENMISTIDEIIDQLVSCKDEKSSFDLDVVTWNLRNLLDNSKMTIIRQQGALLKTAVEVYNNVEAKNRMENCTALASTSRFLNEVFKLTTNETILDVNIVELLPYLLLNFYEQSSQEDALLRSNWLSKILSAESTLKMLDDTNLSLATEITSYDFKFANPKLPWDLAHILDVEAHIKRNVIINNSNRLAILLFFRTMITDVRVSLTEEALFELKNKKVMSVKEYSNAIYHGKLALHLKSQPLVTKFMQVAVKLKKCVNDILTDSALIVDSKRYVDIRNNIKWYNRFYNVGQMILVNKLEKAKNVFTNLEEISLLLRVHYKWLIKCTYDLFSLCETLPLCAKVKSEIKSVGVMINEINHELLGAHDPLKKISKIFKKYLALPLPHSTECSMTLYSRLRKITNTFMTFKNDSNLLKQKLNIFSMHFNDSLAIRHRIIGLWNDIYINNSIDCTISNIIFEVEQSCERSHLDLCTPMDVSTILQRVQSISQKDMAQMCSKIQLLPIYEYMFLLFARIVQSKVCQGLVIAPMTEPLTKFANVPSIPTNLLGLLNAISADIEMKQKQLLLPELFFWKMEFIRHSFVIKNSNMLLNWNGITEEGIENCGDISTTSKFDNFTDGSILLNLISELILNKTRCNNEKIALTKVTLGSYAMQVNQLKCLNDILWRNSVTFTSKRSDFSVNDSITLKFYLNLYMSTILRMHSEHDMHALIARTIERQGKSKKSDLEKEFKFIYVQPVEDLHEVAIKLESSEINEENNLERGKAWLLLGYIQILLFGNIGYIDPIHKINLKLSYLEEDIADYTKTIYVATLQSYVLGMTSSKEISPRLSEIDNYLKHTIAEKNNLKRLTAYRPPSSSFTSLSTEVTNFRNTLCSYEVIKKYVDYLNALINDVNDLTLDRRTAENMLQEIAVWQLSLQRVSERLDTKYLAGYPDIVLPLLSALAQLRHGANILINEIRKRLSTINRSTLQTLICNLIRYPTISPQQENLLSLADSCSSDSTKTLINECFTTLDVSVIHQQFNLIKCGLYEVFNQVLLNKGLTKSLWQNVNGLLQQIVLLWKQQEHEFQKQMMEKESLYKNQTQIQGNTLSEQEELARELRKLFPTQRDEDFGDIEDTMKSSLEMKSTIEKVHEYNADVISKDDIEEIQQIHSSIVTWFICLKWLHRKDTTIMPNYVYPLIQRYNVIGVLLQSTELDLNENLTPQIYNSLNFLVTIALHMNQEDYIFRQLCGSMTKHDKAYNFYKHSNIQEVKQCLPLCDCILNRVQELLLEWPEHPTLQSIKMIIERIYSFPIISSVSRFLSGLELLLVKMHQWEENAHSGVSISEYTLMLTQQIISWRKLELSYWKDCLNIAFKNSRSNSSKWWFYLYTLFENYVLNSEPDTANELESSTNEQAADFISKKKLTESLELFMNEASLAEFEPRLNLLFTFHCHVYYFDSSPRKNELLAILWNIYNYYKQFVMDVNAKINALRTPIVKKLKDFVKIVRWNDINYWSVKETVEKTHRTLYKFIKEFETGLKQNVSSCLIIKSESENTDLFSTQDNCTANVINAADFIISKSTKIIDVSDLRIKSELVRKTEELLAKAKSFCQKVISLTTYPDIRLDIEDIIESFMEQSVQLKNMEVDKSLSKDKQKSHAKSILQKKKMTLANYFKTLNELGVSYRTGILAGKNNIDTVVDFTISPLDLSVITQYFTMKKTEKQMLTQWKNCDKYYYKSLIKLNALNATLNNAQTDLGIQNIERCKGYSTHIMLLAHKQKRILSDLFNDFMPLHLQISNLSQSEKGEIPTQRDLHNSTQDLKETLIILEAGLEQVNLYLKCCPMNSASELSDDVIILGMNELPILNANQGDIMWENANSLIKTCLELIKTIANSFDSNFMLIKMVSTVDTNCFTPTTLLTSSQFKYLEDSYGTIERLELKINELIQIFSTKDAVHPITESIIFLKTKIQNSIHNFKKMKESLEIQMESDLEHANSAINSYEETLESLIKNILLAIQKKYKRDINPNDDSTHISKTSINTNNDKTDIKESVENKLNEKLINSLCQDIAELKLKEISRLFNTLSSMMYELDVSCTNYCNRLLLKCLPLLEQYILFVEFYLNEQVATFRITCKMLYLQLNVFLNLATNGFCVPKDLDLEEDDTNETGENTNAGGMGLGEGEGQKDVSDRIENEDQLEDAKPSDQDEKQEQDDKDYKEEEKGINMSEDFDSKLHDIEEDDKDEEKSDEDENDDLEKEMGETEEGAEQLDQEIWGDKEESSDDENNESEDKQQLGSGEQIGDKEIGASDNTEKKNDHDDGDDNDQEESPETQKKEINEMNETETNDDQIDPYHGKQQPQPEPEPLDLPEDLNLDNDDDVKEDGTQNEENPFDIDEMKESKSDRQKDEMEDAEQVENENETHPNEDSSEDEGQNMQDEEEKQNKDEESSEGPDRNSNNQSYSDANDIDKAEEDQDEETETQTTEEEKVSPSINDRSEEMDATEQVNSNNDGSRDKVAEQSLNENQEEALTENDQVNDNSKGAGQSQSEQEKGHSASTSMDVTPISQQENASRQTEKRKNPGESDENRSLVDKIKPEAKKMKMINTEKETPQENAQKEESEAKNTENVEICEHIKDSDKFDDYTIDAATEEQVKQQASDTDNQKETENDAMDIEKHQEAEEENNKEEELMQQCSERISENVKDKQKMDTSDKRNNSDEMQMETVVEIDGEITQTITVPRGNETTYHTKAINAESDDLALNQIEKRRFLIEKILSTWTQVPSTEEALVAWNYINSVTESSARDLAEKLRLVLEPTQASKLKGDYRTGRRINMRKIIPYIASQFRKDKIWLRRTKPSKRDYQIVVAVDDSSSMADNHSKELAFESLSLISKAMTYLEIGQFCIMSFGEHVNVLHPLGENFTEQSGSRLVQEMKFDQKKTMVGELVNFTVDMFETQNSTTDNAKLLIVLSDGRGVFSEGMDRVNRAVRRAKLADIFLVFIIVDNPVNKDSILDIRMPIFEHGKLLGIHSYMDSFPFPFYMILRDINTLPSVLSDALRQWFELVGKIDA